MHIQNSFRGLSVKNPCVSVRGMRYLLNIYSLDVGLKRVGSPSTGKGKRSRGAEATNMDLGKCIVCRHLCMFHFRKGVREVILRRRS